MKIRLIMTVLPLVAMLGCTTTEPPRPVVEPPAPPSSEPEEPPKPEGTDPKQELPELQGLKDPHFRAAAYDEATQILLLQYIHGPVYRFSGVSKEIHEGFLKAENKRDFFQTSIQGAFPTVWISD